MAKRLLVSALLATVGVVTPALAISTNDAEHVSGGGSMELPPYLQCVPFARELTGIRIIGDAHTWWEQAAGRYARGKLPKVGAVMNFRPYGNSRLGHVAAVTRIVDSRTVLVSHANWSPIDGRRGQIERDVRVIDTSPANDWSTVRVWFAPNKALGTTHWPLYGFIYNHPPGPISINPPRLVKLDGKARMAAADWKSPRSAAPVQAPAPKLAQNDPIGAIIARRTLRR